MCLVNEYINPIERETLIEKYIDDLQLNSIEAAWFRRVCRFLDFFHYRGTRVDLTGAV